MRTFMAASGPMQASLIPPIPALYYWVIDFDGHRRTADEWRELLQRFSSLQGPKQRSGSISHLDLECRVSPEVISPDFRDELIRILTDEAEVASWASKVLLTLQRPLYVGITSDLAERVDEHFNAYDGLNNDLGEQLDISDCSLFYFELPVSILDEVFALNPESPDDPGDGRAVLPRALRVAEYAAIRTAMPLFNTVKRSDNDL
jgi:hypothetical protein